MSNYDDIVNVIGSGLSQFTIKDALDILFIAVLLYYLIVWTKQTRAYQVLKGFGILFLCYFLSQIFELHTLNWVLSSFVQSGVLIVAVLFQPELRRAFEHIGRGKLLDKSTWTGSSVQDSDAVREIKRAILSMSRRRVGALIVVERDVALGDILASGTAVNADVSGALIENIFEPNTPLHDGAMIIRGDRVAAAACILPLSDDVQIGRELGTRHRAALGVSTVSDSITFVVSEETGTISMAREGKLVRYLDEKALNDSLEAIFLKTNSSLMTTLFRRMGKAEEHSS